MTWTIVDPPEHKRTRIRRFLQENIAEFSGRGIEVNEGQLRAGLTDLLPADTTGSPFSAIWRAAYTSDHQLIGAAYAHAPYEYALEMLSKGEPRSYCQDFLRSRRTLGAIAVSSVERRRGLGSALLSAVEDQARQEGTHHLMGFMDERSGRPGFYAKNNYQVLPRNKALPPIGPVKISELHPVSLNGHWFYRVL